MKMDNCAACIEVFDNHFSELLKEIRKQLKSYKWDQTTVPFQVSQENLATAIALAITTTTTAEAKTAEGAKEAEEAAGGMTPLRIDTIRILK